MDLGTALACVAAQLVVPGLMFWRIFKLERTCESYRKLLLERCEKDAVLLAKLLEVPLVEGETSEQLLERIQRVRKSRGPDWSPLGDKPN